MSKWKHIRCFHVPCKLNIIKHTGNEIFKEPLRRFPDFRVQNLPAASVCFLLKKWSLWEGTAVRRSRASPELENTPWWKRKNRKLTHHLYFPFFILIWLWSPQWSLEITENVEDIGAKSQWHGGFREAAGEQLTVTCTRQWQHPGLGRPFLVMLWHIKMGLPQLSLREMFWIVNCLGGGEKKHCYNFVEQIGFCDLHICTN